MHHSALWVGKEVTCCVDADDDRRPTLRQERHRSGNHRICRRRAGRSDRRANRRRVLHAVELRRRTQVPELRTWRHGDRQHQPWVGIEGDVAFGVGMRQDVTFNGALLADQKTPNMLTYSGNVDRQSVGSDRRVVPYLAGGAGALTMFNTTDVENLGVTSNETYFTSNIGGGVRWFASSNSGPARRLSPRHDQEQGRGAGVLRPGKPEGPPDRGQLRVHLLTGTGLTMYLLTRPDRPSCTAGVRSDAGVHSRRPDRCRVSPSHPFPKIKLDCAGPARGRGRV